MTSQTSLVLQVAICDITLLRVKLGAYIILNPNMGRSRKIAMCLIICQVFVLVFMGDSTFPVFRSTYT